MQYHNRESLQIGYQQDGCSEYMCFKTEDIEFAMKMLTDYLMFLNPDVKTDEISVSLSFYDTVGMMVDQFDINYDLDADWRCCFYADGTESSPEQFSRCLELINKYDELKNASLRSYSADKKV